MSEQYGRRVAMQRPTSSNKKAWIEYWGDHGQPWRKEPEIDAERQKYLTELQEVSYNSTEDITEGIVPFKGIRMSRADVEWLIATLRDESEGSESMYLKGKPLMWIRLPVFLSGADLRGVNLSRLPLEKVDLSDCHLEGVDLTRSQMGGTNLRGAFFDAATKLNDIVLESSKHHVALLADIHWGDVNVAVVNWSAVSVLGDEIEAEQRIQSVPPRPYALPYDISGDQTAVRAYRQLAVVLRNQGLNEDAARFTYRAQLMQRMVFRYQSKYWQYLFSLFMDLLAGYGYKPWRSFAAYLIVIATFAIAYFIIGHTVGPELSPLGSFVFSMTSFHGRGFFPGGIGLDDPLTVLAALEALVGLLIEVTFIATLTQRLFGK